jgi:hypothetical protein
VWQALNDPEVLRQCIPGCETIEKLSDTAFQATATAKVGPVKAKFKGKVELTDMDPPNGYTISGEGTGGAAGFAKGGAKVALADLGGGRTRLDYDVDATVGGKLAQIGQRLVDGAARKIADSFFDRFAVIVGGPVEAAPAEAATPSETAKGLEALGENQARIRQLSYFGVVVVVLLIVWMLASQF